MTVGLIWFKAAGRANEPWKPYFGENDVVAALTNISVAIRAEMTRKHGCDAE